MLKKWVFYTPDGMINMISTLANADIEGTLAMSAHLNLQVIEGVADWNKDYVKDGVVTQRPECPAVLEGALLTNLPVPCEIYIDGNQHDVDEDTVSLEMDQPGTYRIGVRAFPYMDGSFELVIE